MPATEEKEEGKKNHVSVFSVRFCKYERVYGKVCSLFSGQRQVNLVFALSLAVAAVPQAEAQSPHQKPHRRYWHLLDTPHATSDHTMNRQAPLDVVPSHHSTAHGLSRLLLCFALGPSTSSVSTSGSQPRQGAVLSFLLHGGRARPWGEWAPVVPHEQLRWPPGSQALFWDIKDAAMGVQGQLHTA